ncbi:OmpA family protein [Candidatus Dependentiae bacterium]|nr:OmpA family protein [Candidatus Dependentiae bacterium]
MPALKCKHCGGINPTKAGVPDYMLTFGDLNSLLLTFFVLLIASASFDVKKFNIIVSAFQGSFGVFEGGKTVTPADLPDLGVKPSEIMEEAGKIVSIAKRESSDISEELREAVSDGKVEIQETEEGLVIQVTDQMLFDPGNPDLKSADAKKLLSKVGKVLNSVEGLRDRNIRIEGHTDDIGSEFENKGVKYNSSSNWELSALRATNVLRFLGETAGVDNKRLSAAGYGQYKPLPRKADESEDQWRSRNRRVDIVVLRSKK